MPETPMNRYIFALLAGVMVSACAERASEPAGAPQYNTSIDDPAPPAEDVAETDPQALAIGMMHEPDTAAYCTLMQAAHEFVYDDPDTWRFVFLSEAEGEAPPARIRINDEVLAFSEERKTEDAEGVETWRYRSEDRGILVELQLKPVDGGVEHTDYEGTMAIIEPVETEKMGVKGSCGV
jgi:hypothetical protein